MIRYGVEIRLVLVLVLALAAAPCRAQQASESRRSPDAARPSSQTAEQHGLKQPQQLRGIVMPLRRVVLHAPLQGRVTELAVQPGDQVDAGSLLVRLDPRRLTLQLAEAQAQQEKIELERKVLEEGLSQLRRTENRIRREQQRGAEQQRSLRSLTRPDYPGRVAPRDSSVMRAPAREEADAEIEDALDEATVGRLRLRANEGRLLSLRRQAVRAQHTAQAMVKLLKEQLQQSEVLAPLEGVVAQCFVQRADTVQAGDQLVEVIQTNRVKVVLWLPDDASVAQLARRERQWTARVRLPGGDASWIAAQVGELAPEPNPRTGQTMLELELDNPAGNLRAGMAVDAILEVADAAEETPTTVQRE